METLERNLIAVRLLGKVFSDGAYSAIELNKELNNLADNRDKAYVTRLFYGVLSKNTQLDYILSVLVKKNPKPIIRTVLKMGFYMLRYMKMPDYAVIDTQVNLTKKLGKKELSALVNAVLRASSKVVLPISDKSVVKEISVNCSCPEWIVKKLIQDYGVDFAREFLSANLTDKTHIRINKRLLADEQFLQKVPTAITSASGYYVDRESLNVLAPSEYTIQSLSSVLATEYYAEGVKKGAKILDVCSAPGGKAVYIAYLTGGDVTACDVHPHRVELIKSYANRMGEKITAKVSDATKTREDFIDKFDCVVCDVPCSGVGVIYSKPDVMLSRKESDIASLSALQAQILETSSKYVKVGGYLNYSTCTVFKQENDEVVNAFLKSHPEYELIKGKGAGEDGFLRLFPHESGCDGFFVAKLRRKV